jgi:DNA-binding CsgD family transcriptional regulator
MSTIDQEYQEKLARFFDRHFEQLIENSLALHMQKFPTSALNSLPQAERRRWLEHGLRQIIASLFGDSRDFSEVYYPKVSELENLPFFGIDNLLDSCEGALLPDEAMLPLLWEDYACDTQELLRMVLAFRAAQNNGIKAKVLQLMDDVQRQLELSRKIAIADTKDHVRREILFEFSNAIRMIRTKTNALSTMLEPTELETAAQVLLTEIKMLQNDLMNELLKADPSIVCGCCGKRDAKDKAPRLNATDEAPRLNAMDKHAKLKSLGLTAREIAIMECVLGGKSNAEISSELKLAKSTVKNNISSILAKLGKTSRVQIVVYAVEQGLYFGA